MKSISWQPTFILLVSSNLGTFCIVLPCLKDLYPAMDINNNCWDMSIQNRTDGMIRLGRILRLGSASRVLIVPGRYL